MTETLVQFCICVAIRLRLLVVGHETSWESMNVSASTVNVNKSDSLGGSSMTVRQTLFLQY